jgi:hypothetical protein
MKTEEILRSLNAAKQSLKKLVKYFPSPPRAKNRKLHRSDYQSSESNRIVVDDPATPRKDDASYFTDTIRMRTKNSLSIYN